jgi:periplasmic protein TonB
MSDDREAYVTGRVPVRERVYAGAGAGSIVAVLGYALLLGLNVQVRQISDRALTMLNLKAPPPPPPPKEVVRPPEHPRPRAKEAPAPPNLRNKAATIVPPPPVVHLPPPPPPVVVAPVAGMGMAANAGASDRPGPGTGAGGYGNGTGGGGEGDGEGDNTPPRQIRGELRFSDLPPDLREAGANGSVAVRYRVETDGRVTNCVPHVTSGRPDLGPATCAAIERRFHFKPSLDPDGRPVVSTIVETHSWYVDRSAMRDDDR